MVTGIKLRGIGCWSAVDNGLKTIEYSAGTLLIAADVVKKTGFFEAGIEQFQGLYLVEPHIGALGVLLSNVAGD